MAGAEVYDVAVVHGADGKPWVIAATEGGLRTFDARLNHVTDGPAETAGCRKVMRLSAGGSQRVLCLFVDGSAAVLGPGAAGQRFLNQERR